MITPLVSSNLENQLDNVSGGEIKWNKIVKEIYDMFHPKLLELGHSDNLEKDKFKRVLGTDPKTGYQVQTYIAKYGPVVQLTKPDNKHKFAPLKDIDMKDVTLEQALKLLYKANKEKPLDPDTLNYLGFANRKVDNIIDAEVYYIMGLEIDPKHVGINEYLGELYVLTNRIDLAKGRLNVLKDCNCEEYQELKSIIDGTKKSKY